MEEKKTQRIFVERYLILSMFDLLEEKSYDKITIKELCEHAGVSRMSFYRNYDGLDDLLLAYFDSEFEKFYKELKKCTSITSDLVWNRFFDFSFQSLQRFSSADFVWLIIKSHEKYVKKVFGELLGWDMTNEDNQIKCLHFSGGIALVLEHMISHPNCDRKMIKRNMRELYAITVQTVKMQEQT